MYKESKSNNSVIKYFDKNTKSNDRPKDFKKILSLIFKWTKIFAIIVVLVSMLWGCIQTQLSNYNIYEISDMTGKSTFLPGLSFEIIIESLGEKGGKNHLISIDSNGNAIQYGYNVITNWTEAWTNTSSPFYGLFVYPLAFLITFLIRLFSGTLNPELDSNSQSLYGLSALFAIIITVLFVRTLSLSLTWKSQKNQIKMQQLQLKQSDITGKYKDKKDLESKRKQQAEISALYKKEGISQFSSIVGSFASLPLFLAIYSVIRSSRTLKIGIIGEVGLIEVPWKQITSGNYVYIALIAVYLPVQIISMLLPTLLQYVTHKKDTLSEEQLKARKKQLIIQLATMLIFIFVVSSVASGVAIYWIISSFYQICQTLGFFFYNQKKNQKGKKEIERRLKQSLKTKK